MQVSKSTNSAVSMRTVPKDCTQDRGASVSARERDSLKKEENDDRIQSKLEENEGGQKRRVNPGKSKKDTANGTGKRQRYWPLESGPLLRTPIPSSEIGRGQN